MWRRLALSLAFLAVAALAPTGCAPGDVRAGVSVGSRGGEVHQARDTLAWTERSVRREDGRCRREGIDSTDVPCVAVAITWPEFGGGPQPLRDSAAAFVRATAFLEEDDTPGTSADSVAARFVRTYRRFASETGELVGLWSLEREVTVACQESGRVSLRASEYEYTGGAHGMQAVRLVTLRQRTGTPLRLTDVATDTATVRTVAERLFREQREIPAGQTLAEAGYDMFEDDRFALTPNFHLCRDTLTFRYDAYEIAPYALGPTEIVVPMRELRTRP